MDQTELIEISKKLWKLIEKNNCIVWIGSGLSVIAGYPNWKSTINQLCNRCCLEELDQSKNYTAKSLMHIADKCKLKNPDEYSRVLSDLFGHRTVRDRRAYHLLLRLPFKGYITTNFDHLLMKAADLLEDRGKNIYKYPHLDLSSINTSDKSIYYIHGLAREENPSLKNNLVLSNSEFYKAYSDPGVVSSFLKSVLQMYNILFIGCQLEEDEIKRVLHNVNDIQLQITEEDPRWNKPQKSMLLATESRTSINNCEDEITTINETEKNRIKYFNELSIDVIKYIPRDENLHEEIEYILEKICDFAEAFKRAPIRISPREDI
ncbi:SIR2 family protein [candidate division KSB1 bacterium]|nr:SIR2 family protein [candidate division KSB1 bacterium]